MPTRKEVSKLKADFIQKRKGAINSKIGVIQNKIFEDIAPDFISMVKKKDREFTKTDLLAMERKVRKAVNESFTDIMRETTDAARSVGDLNLMYYSTMLETNRLDDIRVKTKKIIDRKLGILDGKIKRGGFIDRALNTKSAQAQFMGDVKKLLRQNASVQVLKDKMREFVTGGKDNNGFLSKHYNNVASDLLITVDRNNSNIFADDLGLKHFIFAGGLLKTSRAFCLDRNGKIFTRDQADKWIDLLGTKNGPIWDEKRDGSYDPFQQMGGLGCLHAPDWITPELANGIIREQNRTAADRNKNFRERHNL